MLTKQIHPCWVNNLTLFGRGILLGLAGVLLTSSPSNAVDQSTQKAGTVSINKPVPSKAPTTVLRWRNGDQLKGQILPSSGAEITWKAPWFSDPFVIHSDHLRQIQFSPPKKVKQDADVSLFRFSLNNGDRIIGELLSIDKANITLTSKRFISPITIPRSTVERVDNADGKFFQFLGLTGISDWTSADGKSKTPKEWFTTSAGDIGTHRWNGGIFQEIIFPETVEISFRVSTPYDRPEVEISFTGKGEKGARLETWDDTLVLTHESRFVRVMDLTDDQKELHLRVFWNQKSGDISVCEPSGKLLAKMDKVIVGKGKSLKGWVNPSYKRGFSLVNRTTQLKFSDLTVRNWDGKSIPVINVEQARIETTSGSINFNINDLSLQRGSKFLSVSDKKVPIAEVASILLKRAGDTRPTPDDTELAPDKTSHFTWQDGSQLSGELLSVNSETTVFQSEWSSKGIEARLDTMTLIKFPALPTSQDLPGAKIIASGLSLRGELCVGKNSDSPSTLIAWQPPGSQNSSPIAENSEAIRVVRINYPAANRIGNRNEALLHLSNHEILSGKLISIEADKVQFSSSITGDITIPSGKITAIALENREMVLEGFGDDGWTVTSDKGSAAAIAKSPDKSRVTLKSGTFGHPSIMTGDYIRFQCDWKKNSYGSLTVRLFCADGDTGTPSFDLVLAAQGDHLFIGELQKGGGFRFGGERIPITDNKGKIWIITHPDKIEVQVNGRSAFKKELKPEQISGNGIYFKLGGGWQGWNGENMLVELSDFQVNQSPGFVPMLRVDSQAKKNALTIPRFQKSNPATHILVAPNSDILRGKLTSLNGDSLHFVSKSTEIEMQKNRVAAIIWPKKIEQPKPSGESDDPIDPFGSIVFDKLENLNHRVSHQLTLNSGTKVKLSANEVSDGALVGKSNILGICRIPFSEIREMKTGPSAPIYQLTKKETGPFADWILKNTPEPKIPGASDAEGEPSPLIGTAAPDFSLTMLNEKKFKLSDQKGKVVILDFWATWCGPCIQAMPDVMQVAKAFQKQAPVVFCSINQAETEPLIQTFLKKREWQGLPVALDFDMTVSDKYQVEGIPHTIVIGKDGRIAWMHSGYTKNLKNELAKAIGEVLKK